MSKYLEFKQVPFKGKTKRFEVISKSSVGLCKECYGKGWKTKDENNGIFDCDICKGTGKTDIILGRISWYGAWRQYIFSPAFETYWNKDCLNEIQLFLINLMFQRRLERNPKLLDKLKKQPKTGVKEKILTCTCPYGGGASREPDENSDCEIHGKNKL